MALLELMQTAIEQARLSRGHEDDPLVGAVLADENGIVEVARRGELAAGDHAEFTLLQKKLRSTELTSGHILYTTLEPCTTRSHNKLPCAEWIVSKKIKKVVIGILDPNPVICGRGYWYLVENGVEVDFFAPSLAAEIRDLNAKFIYSQRGRGYVTPQMTQVITRRKSPEVSRFRGFGWGSNVVLQESPDIRSGWPAGAVNATVIGGRFEIPEELESRYQQFYQQFYSKKRFDHDGVKYLLTRNPAAFEDAPTLKLEFQETKYSHVQFYQHFFSKTAESETYFDRLLKGDLNCIFPHSFCAHIILLTSDNKILLTQRSAKTAYYPGTWSLSIEEQLAPADFEGEADGVVLRWFKRAIREELRVPPEAVNAKSLTVLSVFLEANVLNISCCVFGELYMKSDELSQHIASLPTTDREFEAWEFIEAERAALLEELFHPRRAPHPTTGYRLLSAFIKLFGVPKDTELRDASR